jgi:hypothetical protein
MRDEESLPDLKNCDLPQSYATGPARFPEALGQIFQCDGTSFGCSGLRWLEIS